VCLNAEYADAYFLYLQERMLNFVTVGLYKKCCGETYPKWLDSKLQWIGNPPPGYNNHFRIFFNKGSLCERITYYITSTILFTLFGWLPFFRPIFLCWHYQQMVSRLVFGGSQATLDSGYNVGSFFGAYLASCCGCCGHRILVFVDSHLHLQPAGILPGEGERDMGALGQLVLRESAPIESSTSGVNSEDPVVDTAQSHQISNSAVQMDEEVLRLVGLYHVSPSGLKILNDVGVVVASDLMDIDDSDLTHYGMKLLDRKKVVKIRAELQGSVP
jgi:hypothetical protein